MVYKLLAFLNIDGLSRFFFERKALILLYHNPKPEVFETHIRFLKSKYTFVSLKKVVNALKDGDWNSIPKKALIITFDDGHIGNYKLLPIFKKYKINPTIYLCTGIVGTNRSYWFNEFSRALVERMKTLSNKERLSVLKKHDFSQKNEAKSPQALTYQHLLEMKAIVDFQCHTSFHPIVTSLSAEELEIEIKESKSALNAFVPEMVHFAFPNGDYSNREVDYLTNCNFISARTTDIGFVGKGSDPMKLKIVGISDDAGICKLRVQLSCLFGWILSIIKYKNFHGKK